MAAPEAPMGWPSAVAPPCALTLHAIQQTFEAVHLSTMAKQSLLGVVAAGTLCDSSEGLQLFSCPALPELETKPYCLLSRHIHMQLCYILSTLISPKSRAMGQQD